MLDFDDLDAEVDRRVAQGEEVHILRENHQPRTGSVLPPIKHSLKLPGDLRLSQKVTQHLPPFNGKPLVSRAPVLRLLCIHGAGDSLAQDWAAWHHEAPPDIEMATYEPPGHGCRDSEPLLHSLDALCDDAFDALREAMDTGAFALLGHSIGCMIATAVARRARLELGVEPLAVFMMERGPPHLPMLSEKGQNLLLHEPETFFADWHPQVAVLGTKGGAVGKKAMDTWQHDLQLENDTREVGWHQFACPIYALCADWTRCYAVLKANKEEMGELAALAAQAPLRARREPKKDGTTFLGHNELCDYQEWEKWTSHPRGVTIVECTGSGHSDIKTNEICRQAIWRALREIIDAF